MNEPHLCRVCRTATLATFETTAVWTVCWRLLLRRIWRGARTNVMMFFSAPRAISTTGRTDHGKNSRSMRRFFIRGPRRGAKHSAKNSRHTAEVFEQALKEDKTLLANVTACYSKRFNQNFTEQEIHDLLLKAVLESRQPGAEKNQFLADLIDNTELIAKLILEKPIWEVWQTAEGLEFITSDNPLISAVHLPNGKFHPGYGFRKQEIVALFPLAPTACLAAGAFARGTKGIVGYRTVSAPVVNGINEAILGISDRYVYSKTRSEAVQENVDLYGGSIRYGINALMPVGIRLPSVAEAAAALRKACGIPVSH